MPLNWSLIRELDDSKVIFGVKVRVIRTYGFPAYNSREEFNSWECIFHDFQGDRIEATIPKNLIPIFKDQLDEGFVYGIKHFKVVRNMKKFKIVANNYKIIICEDTKIHELFVPDFPMKRFCFRSFEEIQLQQNSCDGSLFDIIGVLTESGEVQLRTTNGVQKKLIELSIDDMSGRRLICTLWEEYMDEYLELFERESQHTNIIIVQFCKISPFKGENRVSNCFKATKLLMNANVPEVIDFSHRFKAISSLNTTTNSSISHGSTNSISDEISEVIKIKTIEDLFDDDENRCSWIIGTVDRIDWDYGWSYLSCKTCTKKLIKVEHQFYCKNCNAYDSSVTLRYKIKVHVKDNTGRAPFLLWDRECVQVIGKPAAELESRTIEEKNGDNFPKDIQTALLGKKMMFKILPNSQQNVSFRDGYSVSKITIDQTLISTYSTSCLDSQESNCVSKMEEGSNVLEDKVEDDTPMETPSSKRVGEEWCDDGQVKRSLDDAFSAALPQKKLKVNIKKEKI